MKTQLGSVGSTNIRLERDTSGISSKFIFFCIFYSVLEHKE